MGIETKQDDLKYVGFIQNCIFLKFAKNLYSISYFMTFRRLFVKENLMCMSHSFFDEHLIYYQRILI